MKDEVLRCDLVRLSTLIWRLSTERSPANQRHRMCASNVRNRCERKKVSADFDFELKCLNFQLFSENFLFLVSWNTRNN